MKITAFDLAQRYVGIKEMPGLVHSPLIMAMLTLDASWPEADEVPWCSAFANWIAWHLRLARSKDLRARSWLGVGRAVESRLEATAAFDVVVLRRGTSPTNGHVGFFAGWEGPIYDSPVLVLGGNQSNTVKVSPYLAESILGIRRLYDE